MKLSDRLVLVSDMITKGNAVIDVGCDHAYVSIRAVTVNGSPRALASDIGSGPLAHAKSNIAESHTGDRVFTEQCDGIPEDYAAYFPEGVPVTAVISGMGGLLTRRILTRAGQSLRGIEELVLSPQKDVDRVRYSIWELGYVIRDEKLLLEDGKYYAVIRATRCGVGEKPEKLTYEEALWGPVLIASKDRLLIEYLKKRADTLSTILMHLADGASLSQTNDRKAAEVYHELAAAARTLEEMEG